MELQRLRAEREQPSSCPGTAVPADIAAVSLLSLCVEVESAGIPKPDAIRCTT